MSDTIANNTTELPPVDGQPSVDGLPFDQLAQADTDDDGDVVVTLTNQDGVQVDFEVLEFFDFEYAGTMREYAILAELDADGNEVSEGTVVLMKTVADADDNLIGFDFIADEDELQSVVAQLEAEQAEDSDTAQPGDADTLPQAA